MRRIGPLVLLSLVWCLFAGSPAEAVSTSIYFFITGNPGTISYAGGTAPLVGSNIDVFHIDPDPIEGGHEFDCVKCTLTFSTGPFAGTLPADKEANLAYSFAGGGSLQIIGGTQLL